MKRTTRVNVWIMLCSCAGMLIPPPCISGRVFGEVPVLPATQRTVKLPKPMDVSLDDQNHLIGRIVNQQGTGLNGATAHVRRHQKHIVSIKANEKGVFQTGPLTGGVYQLTAAERTVEFRVWRGATAPPRAAKLATVVVGPTVRAQQSCTNPSCGLSNCDGSCGRAGGWANGRLGFVFHPLFIGAAVAAAIAIPWALDDDDAS